MDADAAATREIAAPIATVWALITDLTRMGEWSGENNGGRWLGGATGPVKGAAFRGTNSNGLRRWTTKVFIDECTAPTFFSFRSTSVGIEVARWSYALEETDAGCRVIESWCDLRPPFFIPISTLATGVKDRSALVSEQMASTLDGISRAAEAEHKTKPTGA